MIPYNKDTAYKAGDLGKKGGTSAIDGETIIKNDDGKIQVYPGGSGYEKIILDGGGIPFFDSALFQYGTNFRYANKEYAAELVEFLRNHTDVNIPIKFVATRLNKGQESRRPKVFVGDEDVIDGYINIAAGDIGATTISGKRCVYLYNPSRQTYEAQYIWVEPNRNDYNITVQAYNFTDLYYYVTEGYIESTDPDLALPYILAKKPSIIDEIYIPAPMTAIAFSEADLRRAFKDREWIGTNNVSQSGFVFGDTNAEGKWTLHIVDSFTDRLKGNDYFKRFSTNPAHVINNTNEDFSRSNIYVDPETGSLKQLNGNKVTKPFTVQNYNDAVTAEGYLTYTLDITAIRDATADGTIASIFNSDASTNADHKLYPNKERTTVYYLNSNVGSSSESLYFSDWTMDIKYDSGSRISYVGYITGSSRGTHMVRATDTNEQLYNTFKDYLDQAISTTDHIYMTVKFIPGATTNQVTPAGLVVTDGQVEFSRRFMVGSGYNTYSYTTEDIPSANAPTTDGNYVLKCTVTGGVPTYTWVAE